MVLNALSAYRDAHPKNQGVVLADVVNWIHDVRLNSAVPDELFKYVLANSFHVTIF